MAITSHAFGRVTLTDEDAAKFDKQVRFGLTSQAAKDSVARGKSIVKVLSEGGKFTFTVKKPVKLASKKPKVARSA